MGWAAELIEIAPAADTAILETEPDFNLGRQTDLPAGTLGPLAGTTRTRMLVRFDLSALPEGAIVQSAVFRCRVVKQPADPAASVFALYRMLKPWTEGRGDGIAPGGSTAQPGETTWNERMAGAAAWSEPGGSPGEDFAATPSATERIESLATYDVEIGTAGMQDIADWLIAPGSNHGWIWLTESETTPKTARRFASREADADPPRLLLSYTSPLPGPRIVELTVSPEATVLRFDGESGTGYTWEQRGSLTSGDWSTVLSIPPSASGGLQTATNPVPPDAAGFIRLRAGS
jgi:hypothetical protein